MPRIGTPRRNMKVVTIASSKGGTGKSTAVTVLAAKAVQDGKRVAMFDLNADQASLTQWWYYRGEPENPWLPEVEDLNASIDQMEQQGFDWLFIDTPPLDINLVEHAILAANAVVIPVRVGIFDTGAMTPVLEMCRQRRKPHAFLMSAFDGKMPKLNEAAMTELLKDANIFSAKLTYKQAYINSLTRGRAGFEIDKTLQPEVDQLWLEVQRLAATAAPLVFSRGVVNG
jgi:cellulose biosynthesis protein BcsQ